MKNTRTLFWELGCFSIFYWHPSLMQVFLHLRAVPNIRSKSFILAIAWILHLCFSSFFFSLFFEIDKLYQCLLYWFFTSRTLLLLTLFNLFQAQRLGMRFRDLLVKYDEEEIPEKEMVDKLMSDNARADRDRLPNTGCDTEYEFKLSSIFVQFETKQVGTWSFYSCFPSCLWLFKIDHLKLNLFIAKQRQFGTRSTTALSVKTDGNVRFYEKYLEKGVWKDHAVSYNIEKMQ